MTTLRAIGHVAVLTLVHAGITLAIGTVLILAAAALQFLTEGLP
jgi:hypothetical protein